MRKSKRLTAFQREKALVELIKDAEEMGFNGDLIKGYKSQLNQVREEIKSDRVKIKQSQRIERRLS